MTDTQKIDDLKQGVEGLKGFAENISQQLVESNQRQAATRRLLKIVMVMAGLSLLTSVAVGVGVVVGLNTNSVATSSLNVIKDCTTPNGICAQRNNAATQQVISSVSYSTDILSLSRAIPVAQAAGNTTAVQIYQDQLSHDIEVLKNISRNLKDIQEGRAPSQIIPAFDGGS